MNAKEKAENLVNKFLATQLKELKKDSSYSVAMESVERKIAKQCAIDCVEEILGTVPMYTGNLNPKWKYWENVKQEIEKL